MKKGINGLLVRMYSEHHRSGNRLGQSFLEDRRAALLGGWIGTGKKVLDLGCRDGTLTRHFTAGNEVLGVDIDGDALVSAEKEHGFRTLHADLNARLPIEDGSFDVVALSETIEHLPYPAITLAEIRRVLKKNGVFVGNAPIAYNLKGRWRVIRGKRLDYDPTHCQYFSYGSLIRLLNGFFSIEEMVVLKGEKWAKYSMELFARNIAFRCVRT